MVLAKRVDKNRDIPDRLDRLIRYIADAPQEGEKLDQFWIGNCEAGTELEDMPLAIREMMATQKQNTRGAESKSYHFLVSFRPGEKPSREAMQDIAGMYLQALGFEDHQYAAGTHDNTENYHMHVAVNRVHPQTLRLHMPWRDFHVMDRVSRAVEQKYGLVVDAGIAEKREKGEAAENSRANDFEAQRWEQSFLGYVQDHYPEINTALEAASGWQDLHDALAERDLVIKRRGQGLVIASMDGELVLLSWTVWQRI